MNLNEIITANKNEDIALCFPVYRELRSQLIDEDSFIKQILRQQEAGFKLIFTKDSTTVVACAGYRLLEMFGWGKMIYIDDLITKEDARGKGYGRHLLNYIEEQARLLNCKEIHLDSGYQRHNAHRLYLRQGFQLSCHHFSKVISET